MTPAAHFESVTRKFGEFTAVDAVTLDIPQGKLTTLLGPSGCGKTTSLRMLAGYLSPTDGRITIQGKDCTRLAPEKRNLGMVFQSYALFPHMTVADNVAYGLRLRKVAKSARQKRIDEVLEMVGLAHLATSRPKQLSGGQQQRVAIARAVAIEPELLLLDEPLSNLDARLRLQMRSEIRRIQSETGLSVVLVTHDQDEALEMSDQMVLMREGSIQQQGSPLEVFPSPANRFVAEFLGYENFIPIRGGGEITVRPEHLTVQQAAAEQSGAGQLVLEASVTDVAYRGVDVLITVTAEAESDSNVRLLSNVRASDAVDVRPGDKVRVHAREQHLVNVH